MEIKLSTRNLISILIWDKALDSGRSLPSVSAKSATFIFRVEEQVQPATQVLVIDRIFCFT